MLHPEVYSKQEQKRITTLLKKIDTQIFNNKKNALDFGAGTGNLTGKLLKMGYRVVALDISAEMCAILKKKYAAYLSDKLEVINSPIENVSFDKSEFDLLTCYSVLHHLPNYLEVLRILSYCMKEGGILYIDHEASPSYWEKEPNKIANLIKDLYFHSNPAINTLYFQLSNLNIPPIDYTLSDYWHKKEHALSHQALERVLIREGFESSKRTDYYQHATWTPNPLFPVYRLICKPEMSYWIAKK